MKLSANNNMQQTALRAASDAERSATKTLSLIFVVLHHFRKGAAPWPTT